MEPIATCDKNNGRNINFFLMDGIINGRIKCTLANWTGVAYRIPRVNLDLCRDRKDLKQSGIYFLFGVSDETSEQVVYIGQAGVRKNGEGILCRLQEHINPNEDYWSEAVVFTTSNNSFGPTEISYLENRFCTLAKSAQRYIVKNGNEPTQGNVTEEKQSELDEFIIYAKIIMGVLGHKVLEPLIVTESDKDDDCKKDFVSSVSPVFRIQKLGRGIDAQAVQTADGFVVLSGSTIRKCEDAAPSCPNRAFKDREEYKDIIKVRDDGQWELIENAQFGSPSAASNFVLLSSSSGPIEWTTEQGVTLGDFEKAKAQDNSANNYTF